MSTRREDGDIPRGQSDSLNASHEKGSNRGNCLVLPDNAGTSSHDGFLNTKSLTLGDTMG